MALFHLTLHFCWGLAWHLVIPAMEFVDQLSQIRHTISLEDLVDRKGFGIISLTHPHKTWLIA